MLVIKTSSELHNTIAKIKGSGDTIAFVPTMGHLHQGHLNLISLAQQQAPVVVVSIFVNPLQFNQADDLKNYPRTLDNDLSLCESNNVDIVFIPSVSEIYSENTESARLELPQLSRLSTIIEGAARPDHFSGVVTVVKIFFDLVQPDFAVFGKKDFQQLLIIKKMVEILKLPVKIISAETTRETDGLAMSSRNSKLSQGERHQAAQLYDVLTSIGNQINSGNTNFTELAESGLSRLVNLGFKPDYLMVCDSNDLQASSDNNQPNRVILVAVWLGNTRLIDNLTVSVS
ncbi:MAG: pantoate--beta-alanine ligase [Gammaproteobacteria bacterium]